MEIFQSIFAFIVLGIIGFIIYWVGIVLGIGPKVTQQDVNNDPRLK